MTIITTWDLKNKKIKTDEAGLFEHSNVLIAGVALFMLLAIFLGSTKADVTASTEKPKDQEASVQNIISKNSNQNSQESQQMVSSTETIGGFVQKNCTYEDGGNVGRTECIIELLDRKATEREWKQRKIETWKHESIYDLMDFEGSQKKITAWRIGFEKARDAWCEATQSTFYFGSGTPSSIAECELNFELQAINDVNNLYYNKILEYKYHGEDIIGFEPTDADIDALTKTNKTVRGCIWAGETDCEDSY